MSSLHWSQVKVGRHQQLSQTAVQQLNGLTLNSFFTIAMRMWSIAQQ